MLRPAAVGILLLASVVVSPAGDAAGSVEQLYFVEHESERHATGVLDEGEVRGFSFSVDEENLSRVDFILTWTETGDATHLTKPDTMQLTVTGPDGRADGHGPVPDGEIHLRIPLTPVPSPEEVPMREASARLADLASHEGRGEWIAKVRLADAGNPAALAKLDEGNDFQLLVVLTTYEAVPSVLVSQSGSASSLATPGAAWGLATIVLAFVALGVTVALLRPTFSRLLPGRDNTPSVEKGQPSAPSRGDEPPYMAVQSE